MTWPGSVGCIDNSTPGERRQLIGIGEVEAAQPLGHGEHFSEACRARSTRGKRMPADQRRRRRAPIAVGSAEGLRFLRERLLELVPDRPLPFEELHASAQVERQAEPFTQDHLQLQAADP